MPGKSAATKGATRDGGSTTGVQRTRFVDGLRETDVVSVSLKDIDLADTTFQYRLITRTEDLRAAIAREGQVEPVDLTDSKPHRIIDGFRRVHAIRELGWPTVKAIVRHGLAEEAAHELAFIKNVVRKNLSPLEKANAIHLAKKRGCKPATIAEEFGLSEKQMARYEALLSLSKPLQGLVDACEISMAHASMLASAEGIDFVDWVDKIQSNKWSTIELRQNLRKARVAAPTQHSRPLVKIESDECRVYARRFSTSTPREERLSAIAAFRRLISFLEGDQKPVVVERKVARRKRK